MSLVSRCSDYIFARNSDSVSEYLSVDLHHLSLYMLYTRQDIIPAPSALGSSGPQFKKKKTFLHIFVTEMD